MGKGFRGLDTDYSKGLPHVYFLADKTTEKMQLQPLSEKVGLLFRDDFLLSRGFGSWPEFFRYLNYLLLAAGGAGDSLL